MAMLPNGAWIRRFFFPPFCYSCGQALPEGIFCPACAGALARVARTPDSVLDPARIVIHGKRDPRALDGVRGPFFYTASARRALLQFKFRGLPEIGRFFAEEMAEAVRDCYAALPLDAIAFVPQYGPPDRDRGFHHAEVLARHLSRLLSWPVLPCLHKLRENEKQHTLPASRREENVRGVYGADETAAGRTLLLVDDIYTTGATLNACAGALKKKGALGVYGIVAALPALE